MATCPICASSVALEVISFGSAFSCTNCGKQLRITKTYEVLVRVIAVGLGFSLAFVAGFRDLFLFCLGWMLAPFLLKPVWFAARSIFPPMLISSFSEVIKLDLNRNRKE